MKNIFHHQCLQVKYLHVIEEIGLMSNKKKVLFHFGEKQ